MSGLDATNVEHRSGVAFRRTLFVLGVLAISATPTLAQDNREYGMPAQTPENMARFALVRFAFCSTREAQATAEQLTKTPLASAAEAKLVKKLRAVGRQCIEGAWPGWSSTDVRNTVAQIAYRNSYRMTAPTPSPTAPPASFAPAGASDGGTPEQQTAWFLGGLANCVVFVDPQVAHRFVIGPAGVPEEENRFQALKPALARCSRGDVPGLTGPILRGYLANALLERRRAE